MFLAEYSINNRVFIIFISCLLVVAGLMSYSKLGKLEDPEFTIKTALIVTAYPGASPKEVEEQVTDEIEKAVQKLGALDEVRSISKAGLSYVYADIKESIPSRKLPQIWDELRRKVLEAQSTLPDGSYPPIVYDDFGDVYGVFLALTGDGFSTAEMKDYVNIIQRELLLVDDVARVEMWGDQQECVNLEISNERLADLGVNPGQIVETLQGQNQIVDAGSLTVGSERIRLTPTGLFQSIDEIGDLVIRGSAPDNLILMRDVAKITKGYVDPPFSMMRFNGKNAIGFAVSTVSGGNVIHMGEAVHHHLEELMESFPHGLDIGVVSFQSDDVQRAIDDFIVNLIESVIICVVVLLLTMGVRSGLLIGGGLIFTILATFIVMLLLKIDLHRTSLGSLIIAMGMLVDNAIVITEGALIRLQNGESPKKAVTQPAKDTGMPLLGATLIAIFAFLPIYISPNNVGDYCSDLFKVVAISLAISWVLAMVQTPVFCEMFLKVKESKKGVDPYAGRIFRWYQAILEMALRWRITTIALILVIFFSAMYSFQYVDQMFFPKSTRTQFIIDYWLPEGSSIHAVSEDLREIEKHLSGIPDIVSTATCIGSGPPRFYLPYEPELPNNSYGQILVNVETPEEVFDLVDKVEDYISVSFPQAEPRVRLFPLGPSVSFKVEARFSGPDADVLRELCDQAKVIMKSDPNAKEVRDDWRQRVKIVAPLYSQARARRAYVTRQDIAMSLRRITDGIPIGNYRENDELMPILLKAPEDEKLAVENIGDIPVYGYGSVSTPLLQVVDDIKVQWEDPIIRRLNRRLTIKAQAEPVDGNAVNLESSVKSQIEAIPVPSGYTMEWAGESEDSNEAQSILFQQLPISMILIALVIVGLFNAFRPPFIILLILPLSFIGVSLGLLITGKTFGFLALLGALSLIGMLIKNAIVLLDQIGVEIREGKEPYEAVIHSCISRMRPVMMASMTTVLAMIPLVSDGFFDSMAVAIMFGLTFATVLTLIIVPLLYVIMYRISKPQA